MKNIDVYSPPAPLAVETLIDVDVDEDTGFVVRRDPKKMETDFEEMF